MADNISSASSGRGQIDLRFAYPRSPRRVSNKSEEAQKLYLADCEVRVKAETMRSRTLRDYARLLEKHFAFHRKQMSEITSQESRD